MTDRKFFTMIVNRVKESCRRIDQMSSELARLESEQAEKKYSEEYMRQTLRPQIESKKRAIEEEKAKVRKIINGYVEEYAAVLKDQDALKGADMNDDARLLNCGIKLEKGDIIAILARNHSNRTMIQLALRYAEANKIDMGNIAYVGNDQKIQEIKQIPYSVDVVLKWRGTPNAESIFEQILGESSALHAKYGAQQEEKEQLPFLAGKTYSKEDVDAIMMAIRGSK